jgi:hypothetical protein
MLRGAATGAGGLALWAVACGSDEKKETPSGASAVGSTPVPVTAAQLEEFKWTTNAPDAKATPKKGGTFRYATHVSAPGLDPIKSASFESANIYTPVYNRLIRAEYGTEMNPYNPWRLKIKGDPPSRGNIQMR